MSAIRPTSGNPPPTGAQGNPPQQTQGEAPKQSPTPKATTDSGGERAVSFLRVQIGSQVFEEVNGDLLTRGQSGAISKSSTTHNELPIYLNDPDDTIRPTIKKDDKVSAELGFINGPRENVFEGIVWEIGRSLPDATLIIAVDETANLGNMVASSVVPGGSPSLSGLSGGPSTANFERIAAFVKKWEGDGAAGAADLGGHTRFGVTRVFLKSIGRTQFPKTADEAKLMFKEGFWDGGPRCSQYPDPLASVCYDTSINLGAYGNGKTTEGWKSLIAGKDLSDPVAAAEDVIQGRLQWREIRAQRNPSQRAFVKGWQNRDRDLLKLVQEIVASTPPPTTPAQTPSDNPDPTSTSGDALNKLKQASEVLQQGQRSPSDAAKMVEAKKGSANVASSDRSVTDVGGAGKIQADQSALEQVTAEARAKGDEVAVRGNTLEQVSPGNEKSSGVVLNYATSRDLFVGTPRVVKRSGIQLKSGFGALTVQGFSVSGKQMVGATVVTPGGMPTPPSGPINVPEWGLVKASDPIYPGSLYTWGDATKNMRRVPGRGDPARSGKKIMERIAAIAHVMDELSKRFKQGSKLRFSSWYRDPASNRAAGGASRSRHLEGDAVDITDAVRDKIYNTLKSEGWHKTRGGLAISPGSFTHVDLGSPRTWNY